MNGIDPRADWNRVYWDRFQAIRDRLRRERATGLNAWGDNKIDREARRRAEAQTQEAINRWRKSHGVEPPEIREI